MEQVDNWSALSDSDRRIGSADARVVLVEFGDFECPACRLFHDQVLKKLRDRYPDDLAVVFRHWPLSYHPLAMPAARAAECAHRQGGFAAMHDELYEHQDSLGLRSFEAYASASGIADVAGLTACMEDVGVDSAIATDIRLASELGGRGTPTIVINGVLFSSLPSTRVIDSIVQVHRDGAK